VPPLQGCAIAFWASLFRRWISIDFEFRADPGCRPYVWCLVATDVITGKEIGRWWRDELLTMHKAPFPTDRDTLIVSYAMSAEMSCFLQLGWKPPEYLLDLYAEFRWFTNGKKLVFGGKDATKLRKHKSSMLAAAFTLGVPTMDTARKEEMRNLAITRWSFAPEEQAELMDYCAEDTTIAAGIFHKLAPLIDWPRALLRGRYGLAIARMERCGVPIDVALWHRLQADWSNTLDNLIEVTDADYGVFRDGEVADDLLAKYAIDEGWEWPLTPTGKLRRDKKTMKQLATLHPKVNALKELLSTMGKGRLMNLAVGLDGYNRTGLIPFRAVTGRNQPSSSGFIFGPAKWMRGLIMAMPGEAVAYLDFAAEEVCILAALSDDENLKADCLSGDPYIAFAIRAGLAPPDATKDTHEGVRDMVKVLFLSLNYGRTVRGLAAALDVPIWKARDLMRRHEHAYPQVHRWLRGVIDAASIRGEQHSVFGWLRFVLEGFNPRSIRNWPCQTMGFEILMLAAIMLTEAGIEVCAPAHDAFLIKAPLDQIDAHVELTRTIMQDVARMVTGGFPILVDAKVYPHGERYMDKRGKEMWDRVMGLLDRPEDRDRAAA
jgi:DNA polymerase I